MKIREYQIAGSNFIVEHDGRALLADEAGAGKSLTTLHAIMELKGRPVLIFTINPGLFVWQDELEYWFKEKSIVYTGNKKDRDSLYKKFIEGKYQFLIANYFFIEELSILFKLGYWKTIVTDEYHIMGISNHRTNRYKALFPIVKKADNLIMVTGSPMRRNLADLFAPFKMIDPPNFRSYWRYVNTHCVVTEDYFGKTIEAMPRNPTEFTKMRKKYMIRRLKKDILPELPPKTRQVISVFMTSEQRKIYDMMDNDMVIDYKGIFITAANPAVKMMRLRQLLVTPYILGFDVAGGALEHLVEIIDSEFAEGNPVAVFTPFKTNAIKPIKKYLLSKLPKTELFHLHGAMPFKQIKENVQGFQNSPTERKIFLGVIKSGMAITLTTAKVCVFLGYEWTSEENDQAENRLHRYGQRDNVRCLYLLHRDNPIDKRVMEILNTKQHNIDWALKTEDFIKEHNDDK